MHVADHGLIGFGHRFEECILRSFHPLVLGDAGGMDPAFAVRRGYADGHVLERAAEASHRMAFEMRQHENGIVVVDMLADDVVGDVAVLGHRDLDFAAHVHDLDWRKIGVSVLFERGKAFFGGFTIAVVCGRAFHERAADLLHEVLDERRIEIIGFFRFAGMDFDGRFAFRLASERMVGGDEAFRCDDRREEHFRCGLRVGAVFQSFQSRGFELHLDPP